MVEIQYKDSIKVCFFRNRSWMCTEDLSGASDMRSYWDLLHVVHVQRGSSIDGITAPCLKNKRE